MNLNELQYGNPTQTDFHALRLNNYLDPVFEQLKGSPMPKNDSMLTREELNVLRHYVDVIGSDKVLLNRYRKYDIRGMDYLRQVMVQAGADEDDINRLVWGIVNDTMPLINIFKNSTHYWIFFGVFNMYFYLHPDYTTPAWISD